MSGPSDIPPFPPVCEERFYSLKLFIKHRFFLNIHFHVKYFRNVFVLANLCQMQGCFKKLDNHICFSISKHKTHKLSGLNPGFYFC